MSGWQAGYRTVVVLLLAVWGLGCEARAKGPRKVSADDGSTVASAPTDYETFDFYGDLPEVNSLLPPLDNGRIVVPTPKGWRIPARSAKYTAVFARSKDKTYPRIVVIADDVSPTDDLTPENVTDQAEKKAASLDVDVDVGRLGPRPALHYKSVGKSDSGAKLDLETFETYVGRRRYAVELQTLPDAADESHRAALVAVAQQVTFPTPEDIAESKSLFTPKEAKSAKAATPTSKGTGAPKEEKPQSRGESKSEGTAKK